MPGRRQAVPIRYGSARPRDAADSDAGSPAEHLYVRLVHAQVADAVSNGLCAVYYLHVSDMI